MTLFLNVLRSFSEFRKQYSNIESAIEMTSVDTKTDVMEVIHILNIAGVYIIPDSSHEKAINQYIHEAFQRESGSLCDTNRLVEEVGFQFCIATCEAKRLVEKLLADRKDSSL